tara:strand:- start:11066 stop:11668 length:603 start_codon:yes stop_codon:yes gene_type:complete
MKNLHILPTDKLSKLAYVGDNGLCLGENFPNTTYCKPQNIYITNDETIKEGDWFLYQEKLLVRHDGSMNTLLNCKKIILTTDQDLIKDGVQAIDDEFLEWFVKNPSCEEVKVEYLGTITSGIVGYKIIIPKEHPKQETLEEAAEKYSEEDMFKFSQWISHEDWVYLPSKGYWVNEEQEELEQKLNSKEILNMWFEQFKKK